ncbi:hypothetical protein PtA15_4A241 [Puccinia triticina]|uniref:RWD domain-containing protein n=1 Tax=Puccinia triticina TaxID=208348 RepID=A0ABY7CIL5_9BASI|nr:uncharacterized protein PtA15_4A241 [Puccinia triticina]WAQ83792.1 hypothetical protein PtA15_4A241 [Puccinia triticina]WAR54634.1 hypothetical protein PtB15_4B251 [Puccinia triticina]
MTTNSISALVDRLSSLPELADELSTLAAILGDESLDCDWETEEGHVRSISLHIHLDLNNHLSKDTQDDTNFQLLLEIPDGYPSKDARPRLALLAKYIGSFRVNTDLSGSIDKAFEGKPADEPILYDGIETAREIVSEFYQTNRNRRGESSSQALPILTTQRTEGKTEDNEADQSLEAADGDRTGSPGRTKQNFMVYTSEPIVDRKSVFIGHAVALDDPKDVPRILEYLLSDKKTAKASHNMIAWRCESNGFLHQDNDDDGESAAGSRMQHLLNILDVKNVFVCVSRWFGGIHLGSDRFKHINQATRDALLQGRFIPSPPPKNSIPCKPSGQQIFPSGSKKKR